MLAYAVTIFTGAFLLFQVQPLIGKYILPWFGGGPGVWTTCMLFFQVLLLGGYAYAHCSSRWLRPRAQAVLHLVLLAAALALLPITPEDSWKPHGVGDPVPRILALLAMNIGLPFFVLSATGPLVQHWFSRGQPDASPYRLYALSNVGSLLALVSYPFYFETHLTRHTQAGLWGWGLVAYAVCCALCAVRVWKTEGQHLEPAARRHESKSLSRSTILGSRIAVQTSNLDRPPHPLSSFTSHPSPLDYLLWLLLPASASTLLLATTNKICQDVAVIPFLWVLPLALYLLSFIICFDSPRWYRRLPFGLALAAVLAGICYVLFQQNQLISGFAVTLFVCCIVCHGELYRLKPAPRHLTGYYLMIAAGGALGGLFVAAIAPLVFTDYFELHCGLLLCGLLFLAIWLRSARRSKFARWHWAGCALWAAGVVVLAIALWAQAHNFGGTKLFRVRNFYGVLTVSTYGKSDMPSQVLKHGKIMHGLQFLDPVRGAWPTTYYNERSGVGRTMSVLPAGSRRIGLVGLGVGTLAAYGRAGDYLRFYEINPDVLRLAMSPFTYLANCQGKLDVVLGDARLSLEREPPQNFDLLVLDAFSGEAIPVHLLTKEAFLDFERHIKTNGIMAFHISNLYLNLKPVVLDLARHFNYESAIIEDQAPRDQWWDQPSTWILLSRNQELIHSPLIREATTLPPADAAVVPLWTDDFASPFQIFRWRGIPRAAPRPAEAEVEVAANLCGRGDFTSAIAHYRRALETDPNLVEALNNLAWLLATCPEASLRNGAEAVQLGEKACQLTKYQRTMLVGTLAAAYAEAGRFSEAVATTQKACELAATFKEDSLLARNQELLGIYQAGQSYHESLHPAPQRGRNTDSTPTR